MKDENLKLWHSVSRTDPNYTKEANIGRKITTINPQYQIRLATEQFGPYGQTWGLKEVEHKEVHMPDESIMVKTRAVFFFPNGEFPLFSASVLAEWKEKDEWSQGKKTGRTIKSFKVDTDTYKKIETDITTKALSKLGFNADVFMGQFDDSKYIEAARKATEHQSMEALKFELSAINTIEDLMDYYYSHVWVSQSQSALRIFSDRKNQINEG